MSHCKTSSAILEKTFIINTFPLFNNAFNLIYHFKSCQHFYINTCIRVLTNQYSTGLLVHHYPVRRKIQLHKIMKNRLECLYLTSIWGCLAGVRLKQRIRFPLFERLFCRISVLRGASRRGGGGECYTLAERYGERIRCFTLTCLAEDETSFKLVTVSFSDIFARRSAPPMPTASCPSTKRLFFRSQS
jgi:hypothetical protein